MPVKLSELKSGDKITFPIGHSDCLDEGTYEVHNDGDGAGLYVLCREGRHFLYGETSRDDNDTLPFEKAPE